MLNKQKSMRRFILFFIGVFMFLLTIRAASALHINNPNAYVNATFENASIQNWNTQDGNCVISTAQPMNGTRSMFYSHSVVGDKACYFRDTANVNASRNNEGFNTSFFWNQTERTGWLDFGYKAKDNVTAGSHGERFSVDDGDGIIRFRGTESTGFTQSNFIKYKLLIEVNATNSGSLASGTRLRLYRDGVAESGWHATTLTPVEMGYFSIQSAAANVGTVYIDDFVVTNASSPIPVVIPNSINITDSVQPVDTQRFVAEYVIINATINSSSIFNVTLYKNNTAIQTKTGLAGGNNVGVSFNFSINKTEGLQNFTYFISASNADRGKNSSRANIFIDNYFSLNMSTPQPFNNTQFNVTTININTSVNATSTFNATLYVNNKTNVTRTDFPAGANVFVSFNLTMGAGVSEQFNYSIKLTNGLTDKNNTPQFFNMDTALPTITFTFANASTYFGSSLNGNANFSDALMLFGYNISIDNIITLANAQDLNVTSVNISFSYNTSNLTMGNHTLRLRVADGHTASVISEWDYSTNILTKKIKFKFGEDDFISIKPVTFGLFETFKPQKEKDRYSFYWDRDKLIQNISFAVESSKRIYPARNDAYAGWLIIPELDKWLDFESDANPSSVAIKKIDDYNFIITLTDVKAEDITFNSIGELNVVTQEYQIFTGNATATFYTPVMETATTQYNITFSYNSTYMIDVVNVSLFYNTTNINYTARENLSGAIRFSKTFTIPQVNATTAMPVFWNWTAIGVSNNVTNITSFTQSIANLDIDNCTTYSVYAINFTTRNETNEQILNATVGANVQAGVDDVDFSFLFNLSWDGVPPYSICISPPGANYSTYIQMDYQNERGVAALKTYYLTNATLNNQTSLISLYITDGTSQVKLDVKDENDDPAEDIIIKVLSYDLSTDSYRVTEIVKTDSDGAAQAQMILNTQFYKFILEKDGIVLLATNPTKITSTTGNTFRVSFQTDFFTNYNIGQGVTRSLGFTNSTLTFTYIFSDSTGKASRGCLEIVKRTSSSDTTINESCVTSSAGTINIVLNNPGSATYLAKGTIKINPTFLTDFITVSFDQSYTKWGLEGIFVSFLLITTVTLAGVFSPVVAVALMIVGVVISILANIFYLSWAVLVSFIIVGAITLYRVSRN